MARCDVPLNHFVHLIVKCAKVVCMFVTCMEIGDRVRSLAVMNRDMKDVSILITDGMWFK
jgi:hypothetical protein